MNLSQNFDKPKAKFVLPLTLVGTKNYFAGEKNEPAQIMLLRQVFSYYHQSLVNSNRAIRFIKTELAIENLSFIDQFNVGFVDRTMGKHLPTPDSYEGGMVRGRLQRLGILKTSGHELFRGAIVFPLYDIDGHFVGVYGVWIGYRSIDDKYHHLIWGDSEVGIFNPSVLIDEYRLILCQSPLDAVFLWSLGFHNAISISCYGSLREALWVLIDNSRINLVEIFIGSTIQESWLFSVEEALLKLKVSHRVTTIKEYIRLC